MNRNSPQFSASTYLFQENESVHVIIPRGGEGYFKQGCVHFMYSLSEDWLGILEMGII